MRFKKFGLLPQLILGILMGMLLGSIGTVFHIEKNILFVGMVRLFTTFSSLFSTFLSFIIPLLILSFVTIGLADLGKKANKLFGITLVIAYCSTITAGFSAFLAGKAILPGMIKEIAAKTLNEKTFDVLFTITADPVCSVMTALILAFILGLGIANTETRSLYNCIKEIQEIIKLVLGKIIIPLIPIHIAGLFCKIAAEGSLFPTIKMFIRLYIMILVFQWFYIALQFGVASLVCHKNQFPKIKNTIPAYFTALGTQSSASTIPVSLESAEKNEVTKEISEFVIPLGATIHLAGDTICLVIGSMGILLANGIAPSLSIYLPFIFMLGVTMIAAPGVPGGGVMSALGLITSLLGFSDSMQQLIISLHLSQDSFGTACNISGDQSIALMIDWIDQRFGTASLN